MLDDLEPVHGTYDWNLAFAQNPDEPVYGVPAEMRRRLHHLPPNVPTVLRPMTGPVPVLDVLTDAITGPIDGLRQLVRAAAAVATGDPDDITQVMPPMGLEAI